VLLHVNVTPIWILLHDCQCMYDAWVHVNVHQLCTVCAHTQVQPFELADSSKAGHRKILCFFLVDPNNRVPSTLTCPPQQAEWLKREVSMSMSMTDD
jgi:hypothetical protein